MSEVIVVTSGKGGVGKTTVAANLGCGLALLGNKVVLIDTDIGLRNLDVVMGLENRIVYNLVDVVEGGCRIKQALIKDKNHQGLYLMPSAQTRDKSSVTPQQMKKLTQELTEEFDYVILDFRRRPNNTIILFWTVRLALSKALKMPWQEHQELLLSQRQKYLQFVMQIA